MDEAGNRFSAILSGVRDGRALLDLRAAPAGAPAEKSDQGGFTESGQSVFTKSEQGDFMKSQQGDFGSAHPEKGSALADTQLNPRIALVQGLPKAQKMDLILRQAVEAGVELVLPLQTRYSVVRELGREESSGGGARRARILKEALQQSGSLVRSRLAPTASVQELGARLADEGFLPDTSLYLMFHELDIAKASLHEYCAAAPGAVVLLIGPEGGFAPDETQAFLDLGFKAVHIPGSILRTETAALFAVAAVKTILVEKQVWTVSK